jgi:hypothetical protein
MLENKAKTTLAVEKCGKPVWNLQLMLEHTAKKISAVEKCGNQGETFSSC